MPRDRYIKHDLAKSFNYILESSNPRLSRAIRLYKLQVALLIGKKLQKTRIRSEPFPDNWIRVSRAALLTAGMVARVRLLENIIKENYSTTSQNLMLKTLLRDKTAKSLLRRIMISNNSTRQAHSFSWHELSRLIELTRNKQKSYVPLYHVSLNFALYGGADWQCNWSRSEALLKWKDGEPEYPIIRRYFPDLQGSSTAYKHKGVGYHFAAYNWLDHFGGNYMRPEKPSASNFVDILLDKTDDLDALRSYLGQYAFVRSQLQRQGYVVADLQLSAPLPIREVSFEALPDELTNLI